MVQRPTWRIWLEDQAAIAGCETVAALAARHGFRESQGPELYRAVARDLADPPPWSLLVAPVVIQESGSGQTTKFLFRLHDGLEIETVLMRHHGGRHTVCVSSQAGCAFRCAFCSTGQAGFSRHLRTSEIFDQVSAVARRLHVQKERVTNLVFMGMGEPFHNYERVCDAIRLLTDEGGLAIARRRVTLSTVGLVPEIRRFAVEGLGVNLAVSLHAPNDALRSRLMPINDRYPLAELMSALADYSAATGREVFFEYLLLAGVNDQESHAQELAVLLAPGHHVNLIPYNATPGADWQGADETRIRAFHAVLRRYGLPATVRHPMGRDIAAACGQLRSETQPKAI